MGKSIKESKLLKQFAIWFLIAIMFLSAGCEKKLTLQDYLDLGDKYLLELNYEEAVVAFTKAIELEPRDPNGYLKLAKVYDAQEDYEKAVQILTQGYEATGDAEVKKQKEIYENLLNHEDLIQETLSRARSADRESLWQLQSTDAYQEFITKLDRVIKRDGGDGNWLLIYPCGHCYYGGMEDGKRSGHGIWSAYDYVKGLMEYDSCTWGNDYPNGEGEEWSVRIAVPEMKYYAKANYKEGLYQGNVLNEYIDTLNPAESMGTTYSAEYTDGIPKEVEDKLGRGTHTENGKELFCIYSDDEMNFFAVRGQKYGMFHARKGDDDEKSMIPYSMEEVQTGKQDIEKERRQVMP